MSARHLRRGDRVIIERDEKLYPSKGTWPNYRGRRGTVVSINTTGAGPEEYGVTFGATKAKRIDAWFQRYEVTWRGDPWPVVNGDAE